MTMSRRPIAVGAAVIAALALVACGTDRPESPVRASSETKSSPESSSTSSASLTARHPIGNRLLVRLLRERSRHLGEPARRSTCEPPKSSSRFFQAFTYRGHSGFLQGFDADSSQVDEVVLQVDGTVRTVHLRGSSLLAKRAQVLQRIAKQSRALVGTVDRLEAEPPDDRVTGAYAGAVDQADALRPCPVIGVALAPR